MQGLIAVEGHGQVCMSGTLSDFAGIGVDAAGQVYGQNKSTAFVQMVHQPAGGTAIHFHLTKGRAKKTEEQAMDNLWLELPWWFI